jgi:hypothetical protein
MLVVPTSLIFDCDTYVPVHVAQQVVPIKEKDSGEAMKSLQVQK